MHPRNGPRLFPALLLGASLIARLPASEIPQGEALLKTDVMGVFAHPDDETGVAATLASYARGQGKTVATIYCTRGEGGGNMVGRQGGPALGILREAELRACLQHLGVRACYFLDQEDFAYTESLAATLEHWGKEETLRRLVRHVRALRPEVILTMNPAPTPGQHGNHQAAGLLATEAFRAAADPTRFPEQLEREGLTPWQVRKLYYTGAGARYVASIATTNALPDGSFPWQIAAEALAEHRSQAFGNFAASPWMRRAQLFRLIQTVVPPADAETDLLQGLRPETRVSATLTLAGEVSSGPTMSFLSRPAIDSYRRWTREQGIDAVATHLTADLPVIGGEANSLRLEMVNPGTAAVGGRLKWPAWPGWKIEAASPHLVVDAGKTAVVQARVVPPEGFRGDTNLVAEWQTDAGAVQAAINLHGVPTLRVATLASAPPLDGTGAGFEKLSPQAIDITRAVQGHVTNAADSSAIFRIGQHRKVLYVDVEVRDDVVVSNIAPNDIRGHWRSDSVEICLDPKGGAEHTLGCYKIGVFPFDSTGAVRAARDADARQGPIEQTAPHTRIASRRTPDGYRIQAAIPFAEAGLAGGRRAGFNLILYDGDKTNAALGENINKSRLAWSPRSGVQGRPEDWGRIDL